MKARLAILAAGLLCLSSCQDKPKPDQDGPYSTKVTSSMADTLKRLDSMSEEEVTRAPKPETPDNFLKPTYAGHAPTTLPAMPIELNGRLSIRGPRSGGGSEYVPAVLVKPEKPKTVTLGTADDGAAITYEVGVFEDNELPVTVHILLVGQRKADLRFVGRIRNTQSSVFHAATRTGEQVEFVLSVDARPDAGQPLPSTVTPIPPVTAETPGIQPGAVRRGKQ